jgi:hypothetical protein
MTATQEVGMAEFKRVEALKRGDCIFVEGAKYMVGMVDVRERTRDVYVWLVDTRNHIIDMALGELVRVEKFVGSKTLADIEAKASPSVS